MKKYFSYIFLLVFIITNSCTFSPNISNINNIILYTKENNILLGNIDKIILKISKINDLENLAKNSKEKIKLIFEEAKKEIPELEFFTYDILGSKTTVEAIKKIERYTKKLKEDPLINLNESTNRISSLKNYEDDWLSGSLF